MTLRLSLLLLLCFFYKDTTFAQSRPNLENSYKSTYYYRISKEQALWLYNDSTPGNDRSFFKDLAYEQPYLSDSLPLAMGNYLSLSFNGNHLEYDYKRITPWRLYLLENGKDLVIQLLDLHTQQPVTVSEVKIDKQVINYDPETRSYTLPGYKKDGLLSVTDHDHTFYYSARNTGPKRVSGFYRLKAHRPFRYFYNLFQLYDHGLLHGYYSVKDGRAYGAVSSIRNDSRDIARIISGQKKARQYKSYFYFSKPKYREGDTIKFKAHLLEQAGQRWYDKPLSVFIGDDYEADKEEDIYLGMALSKGKGAGYNFQFTIQDSMDIFLDHDYGIYLKDPDSNVVGKGKFTYEDYELKKAVFELGLENSTHVKGKPFFINLTAKDENGLPMPDTRVSVTVKTQSVNLIKPDRLFVPDTLWTYNTTITKGKDVLQVPDSIFPDAGLVYRLIVVMHNSENERTDLDRWITYERQAGNLSVKLPTDSILVDQPEKREGKIKLYAEDKFGFRVLDTFVDAPYKMLLNTSVAKYTGETGDDIEDLYPENEEAGVSVYCSKTRDSTFMSIANPRRLPVIYHVYKNNKEAQRGIWKNIPLQFASKEEVYYTLAAEFVWAGTTKRFFYRPFYQKGKVKLDIKQPPVVTPGKETDIQITATDQDNKPISGLNLLAYSYTRKFDNDEEENDESTAHPPTLPLLGIRLPAWKLTNTFELSKKNASGEASLNYPFWNEKMLLDTNWAYRFRYPAADSFEYTRIVVQDSVTQVAPVVVENGNIQDVYYVLLDEVPVYFGFTDYKLPYSFKVDTNFHNFKIRTSTKLVTIGHVKVKPGCKTMFSIDQGQKEGLFKAEKRPDTLYSYERERLLPYVMMLDMHPDQMSYAYMENEGVIDLSGKSWRGKKTVGPVTSRPWLFHAYEQFDRHFDYEPYYTYTLSQDLVKMKSNTGTELIPFRLRGSLPGIGDEVLSRDELTGKFEYNLLQARKNSSQEILNKQVTGPAKLSIEFARDLKYMPANIILGKPNDFGFIRIYAGNTKGINNIPVGKYVLLLVDEHSNYKKTGIIEVKANGTNFYRITENDLKTLPADATSDLNALLNNLYRKPGDKKDTDISLLMKAYTDLTYQGTAAAYSGTLYDENKEPIAGASIKIAGTMIGTISDIYGKFDIDIPGSLAPELVISALGMTAQTVTAKRDMKVYMLAGGQTLNEVVISAEYEKVTKENYVGAASRIESREIELMPVSDIIRSVAGIAPGIQVTSGANQELSIRGYGPEGNENLPLIVINGVPYNGNLNTISPGLIASITLARDETTKNLYGVRAKNGVILIVTKEGAVLPEEIRAALQEMPPPMTEDMMVSGMRSNFRDDAYWEPGLVTDKEGKASFKVKFPDDITSWKTFVVGADDKNHTGNDFGNIKSYKPVAASLYLPRFLLDGDTAMLIGKSLNYMPDTIPATTSFYRNGMLQEEKKVQLAQFHNDTLLLTASGADSLNLKYLLTRTDGYFDGEQRTIPLQRIGTKIATGSFMALDMPDTAFSIPSGNTKDTLHLFASASLVDIVLDEIKVLRDYGYLCNEQMASKIIAFLDKEKIGKALQQPSDPKDRVYVQGLIDKMIKNKNAEGLWGWWGDNYTSSWISAHALEALLRAREAGYRADFKDDLFVTRYLSNLERDTTLVDIPALKLLAMSQARPDFKKYISRMERRKSLSLQDRFELTALRQKLHLPYKTDLLKQLQESDIFGNIYWKDTSAYVYHNEVLTTLSALKILRNDSTATINKQKIVNWLLQQRGAKGWRNTYESAQIIDELIHFLPLSDKQALKPLLQFSGGMDRRVDTFPFLQALPLTGATTVRKTGAAPVYLTWYYNKWDTTNNNPGNNFRLQSWFESNHKTVSYLPAGEPVTLKVSVNVVKSAEYVMLEIPIPAGCSYKDKNQSYRNNEIHREYFEDKVSIFCETLPKGVYEFEVFLLPRYAGNYTLNPAKAELMYFPVFYGKEKIKKVAIRP